MSEVITRPQTKKIFEIFLIDFELMAFRFEEVIFDFLPFNHCAFLMPEGEGRLLVGIYMFASRFNFLLVAQTAVQSAQRGGGWDLLLWSWVWDAMLEQRGARGLTAGGLLHRRWSGYSG